MDIKDEALSNVGVSLPPHFSGLCNLEYAELMDARRRNGAGQYAAVVRLMDLGREGLRNG